MRSNFTKRIIGKILAFLFITGTVSSQNTKTTSPHTTTTGSIFCKTVNTTKTYGIVSPHAAGNLTAGTSSYNMLQYIKCDNSAFGLQNSSIEHVEVVVDTWLYSSTIDGNAMPAGMSSPTVNVRAVRGNGFVPGKPAQDIYNNFINGSGTGELASFLSAPLGGNADRKIINISGVELQTYPSDTDFGIALYSNSNSNGVMRLLLYSITIYYYCPLANVPAPANFVASVASSSSITLTGYAVPNATSYSIQNCSNSTTYTASGASYTIPGLQNGSTYTFKVASINGCGTSAYSTCSAPITIAPPSVPTTPTAVETTPTKITVSGYTVSGATGYTLYDCQTGQTYAVPATSSTYAVTVAVGSTHSYKALATNAVGSSAYSGCSNIVTTTNPPATPPAPSATSTISNTTTITTITGYQVAGATGYTIVDCNTSQSYTTTQTTYTINNLPSGSVHSFKVSANNAAGASAYSNCSNSVTVPYPPPPATPGTPTLTVTNALYVFLSWNAVPNATTYYIKDCQNGDSWPVTTTSSSIYVLNEHSTHSYQVMASNSAGNSSYSACSNVVTTPYYPVLATPSNLVATPSNSHTITLTWNEVPGANFYEVYDCDGNLLYNVSTNYLQFTGLAASTTYSFKVKAKNTSNGALSGFSTCVLANTFNYNPDCLGYSYQNDKFMIKQGNDVANLTGVPSLCLGDVEWWIYPNQAGCWQQRKMKKNNGRIWITVWECNKDLSHTSNYIEGNVLINRGDNYTVDFFNLKGNLPGNNTSFFHADGVYDVWFWLMSGSTVTDQGNRFFHTWTDDGNIVNQPAYSVNLRANDIIITNSTIRNNYASQFSSSETVDILAATSITINPNSTLEPGTYYRTSSTVNCDNLQNGYKIDPTKTTVTTGTEQEMAASIDAMSIYPNPSNGIFTIDLSSAIPNEIIVTDVLGKQVYQHKITGKAEINLSELNTGIYLLKATDGNGYSQMKRIVIH